MASRRAEFLATHDRTHGKEAMASCRAEFIAAGGQTVTWADFEAAMAEWVVDLEAAKAAQKEQKKAESSQEKGVPPPQEKRGRTPWGGELGGDRSTVGCRLVSASSAP